MAREFAKQFYNSDAWKATSEAVKKRDKFLCVRCGEPVEEVHHVIPLTPENIHDVNISLNMSNLISLCRACHFKAHKGQHGSGRKAAERYPYEFDASGQLVPRRPPL